MKPTSPIEFLEPANWLTLVRLPLAALLWIAPADALWVASVVAAAAISDMLDGKIAKRVRARRLRGGGDSDAFDRHNAIGAWLDPLCDKTFVVSTLAAVYVGFHPAPWMLFAIAARELIVIPAALAYRLSSRLRRSFRFDFRAGLFGKLATVAQFTAVLLLILGVPYTEIAVAATATIGVIAAVMYLRKAVRIARWSARNEFASTRWEEMQRQFKHECY